MSRDGIQVGDETTVVITDPHEGDDHDPTTQIDGTNVFVRFPDGYVPDFGESVRVKIADVADSYMVAVAVGADND